MCGDEQEDGIVLDPSCFAVIDSSVMDTID